jgi:hypothetical protein
VDLDRWFQLDLALPPGAVTSHYGGRVHVRFDLGSEPMRPPLSAASARDGSRSEAAGTSRTSVASIGRQRSSGMPATRRRRAASTAGSSSTSPCRPAR